ncbi:hypothetical protein VMCG_03839 [Cytospora schulzeri]|uniref:Uncharacterized protein n=1 Tax=Cytospora schulzeri TaxID=448051 RepID=A0A423WV34_9PEZI|nr:hypothetical protein VMCG_03839 [Valsa malicola]
MAPATKKSTTNDTNQQMQRPRAPKRPRGRPPTKTRYQPEILEDESDGIDKPDRPSKVQKKKKAVRFDLGASEHNGAAKPVYREIRPRASGDNFAASTPRFDLHPGGYNPGLQLQGRSLRPTNYPGDYPSTLQPPHNGYPISSFSAPGAPGGFPKSMHPYRLQPQGFNFPGSPYPGSYLHGSSSQGLNHAGDNNYPVSLPRAGQQAAPLAAPGAPGGYPMRPYTIGSDHTDGLSRESPLPPPTANVLPRASPKISARGPSSKPPNPAAAAPQQNVPGPCLRTIPDPAQDYLSEPTSIVTNGQGVPVSAPAVGSQDRPAFPQLALEPRPRVPVRAEPSPQPMKLEAIGEPRLAHIPAHEPAQQNRREGIGAAEAMQNARLAPRLPPIVRLRGQTLHIKNLDDVFQSWPRFQTNERMIAFKAEVKEKNSFICNATFLLPDELVLVVHTDPASLASHLWPQANAHELRLAIEVVIWSTKWDIFMKKAGGGKPFDLMSRTVVAKSMMRYQVEDRDKSPANEIGRWTVGHIARGAFRFDDLAGSISRILESLSALYEPAYLDVFKEDFCDYLDSLATVKDVLLANGKIPTADEYSEFTKKSIPPILRLALLDACEPDRARRCGLYEVLLSQTHRIMRLTSDLYSVEEDMRMGNVLNSFILRFEQCDDTEAAAEAVVEEIKQARQAFDNVAHLKLNTARQAGELEMATCIKKIEFLRQMIAGHRMWCIANNRHHIVRYRQDDGSIRMPLR